MVRFEAEVRKLVEMAVSTRRTAEGAAIYAKAARDIAEAAKLLHEAENISLGD